MTRPRSRDRLINSEIPGDLAQSFACGVTFDSWFTHAANLNHVHGHGRGYVGDLKLNRKVDDGCGFIDRCRRRKAVR